MQIYDFFGDTNESNESFEEELNNLLEEGRKPSKVMVVTFDDFLGVPTIIYFS